MTISTFGVDSALEEEKKKAERVKRALQWKLREWSQPGAAIEASNSTLESLEPQEDQISTPSPESQE
jgi:hypothetical protein